ncbi:MAG: N-acetylmuramoyl-L-alanine amidase [Clostridia bacterium]|nr:N-acetylmuramoyl-L-alanine amidase [Clostridia bacterium]
MKNGLYFSFRLKNALSLAVTFVLFISLAFMLEFSGVFSDSVSAEADKLPLIIIDPGHGGEDGGTQSSDGTLEKEINLEISLKLNEVLNESGYETLMTRDGDYMIYDESSSTQREKKVSDIHNRMKAVEENGDCILISVHQNYFTESKYDGTQVFYSKNNPASKLLADEIQRSVVSSLQPDNTRQIKKSGTDIYLLYHSLVPSVMVECGFMSNEAEAARLKDEEYQNKMAQAIADGLTNYMESNPEGDKYNGSENKKYFRLQ